MTHDNEALHTKWRPTEMKHVVGQREAVKALKTLIKDKGSQAFLFFGPSGCGKTTLARITAAELGVQEIVEIDAATNTGVDDMRRITSTLDYQGFGVNGGGRGILIDECHRISRQAWDSLLKSVEEPPPHITWFFCTTEPARVPATIKTRCSQLEVKPVSQDELRNLVDDICAEERIKLQPGVADAIVKNANGSPRQALVSLALAKSCANGTEAKQVLRLASESDPPIALAKFLLSGKGSWAMAMDLVEAIGEKENLESVRIQICNYVGGALKNTKKDREALMFLQILDAFADSYNPAEGWSPLLQSIGRVLFSGGQE